MPAQPLQPVRVYSPWVGGLPFRPPRLPRTPIFAGYNWWEEFPDPQPLLLPLPPPAAIPFDIRAAIVAWFNADPALPGLFPGGLWLDTSRATVAPFVGFELPTAPAQHNTSITNPGQVRSFYVQIHPIIFKVFAEGTTAFGAATSARQLGTFLRDKLNLRKFVFQDGVQDSGLFYETDLSDNQDPDPWKQGLILWQQSFVYSAHVTRPFKVRA